MNFKRSSRNEVVRKGEAFVIECRHAMGWDVEGCHAIVIKTKPVHVFGAELHPRGEQLTG